MNEKKTRKAQSAQVVKQLELFPDPKGKTSFDIKNITERGFKPLKMARYAAPIRGGVVGFVLSAYDSKLYVSAIYNTGKDKAEKIGEPCQLPGLKVYLKAKNGIDAGIYNLKGERVTLGLKEFEGVESHG